MTFRTGTSRRHLLLATLVAAFLPTALLWADQTVQVGPANAFSPSTVTVAPGEAVIWSFQALHTSTSDSQTGPEVWDSGFLSTGTFSHTFTTPGSYPYYCQVHSSPGGTMMNGVVIVSGLGVTPTATPIPTTTVPPALTATPSPTTTVLPATPSPTTTVSPAMPSPTTTVSPALTATPTPTVPPTAIPATPIPPAASGIPTLDPTGTAIFILVLAAAGFAALQLTTRR